MIEILFFFSNLYFSFLSYIRKYAIMSFYTKHCNIYKDIIQPFQLILYTNRDSKMYKNKIFSHYLTDLIKLKDKNLKKICCNLTQLFIPNLTAYIIICTNTKNVKPFQILTIVFFFKQLFRVYHTHNNFISLLFSFNTRAFQQQENFVTPKPRLFHLVYYFFFVII